MIGAPGFGETLAFLKVCHFPPFSATISPWFFKTKEAKASFSLWFWFFSSVPPLGLWRG